MARVQHLSQPMPWDPPSPAGGTSTVNHHSAPSLHQVKKQRKGPIPACQHYCLELHLCRLLPLESNLLHVGCTDAERLCSKLISSVTSGWGPCHRCCERHLLPPDHVSHLVPSWRPLRTALPWITSPMSPRTSSPSPPSSQSSSLPSLLPPSATLPLPRRPSSHPRSLSAFLPVCPLCLKPQHLTDPDAVRIDRGHRPQLSVLVPVRQEGPFPSHCTRGGS